MLPLLRGKNMNKTTNNRKCKACGKEYRFCPSCGTNEPLWKKTYDCIECKDAYKALADFNFGHISAEEANKILISTGVKFVDSDLKPIINRIKSESAPKKVEKVLVEESEKKIFKSKKTIDIVNED